jgi:hypothetical protein
LLSRLIITVYQGCVQRHLRILLVLVVVVLDYNGLPGRKRVERKKQSARSFAGYVPSEKRPEDDDEDDSNMASNQARRWSD